MELLKRTTAAIILALTTSCTIPVVQDPIPLPVPQEPVYPFIDSTAIVVQGDTVTLPKRVMNAISRKLAMKSAYIGECRAVIESTQ